MERDTIEKLEEMSKCGEPVDITDVRSILLSEGMRVESLEKFNIHRDRFKGIYETHDLKAFIEYHDDREEANTFVDMEAMTARTIFDLGTPEEPLHCEHRALLTLKATSEYRAFDKLHKYDFSQEDLFNWLQDWPNMVEHIYDTGEKSGEMTFDVACMNIRNITIESQSQVNSQNGDFVNERSNSARIEAKSSSGERLPAIFTLQFVPYRGFRPRTIDLRLAVKFVNEKPMIALRTIGLDDMLEAISEEFLDHLESKLDCLIGSFFIK